MGIRDKTEKFDDFMKKHGYPTTFSLPKKEGGNPPIVKGKMDVHSSIHADKFVKSGCVGVW